MDRARTRFGTAGDPSGQSTRQDPLILDLDGDGIETKGVKAGAYFDHDGDGFAEQTGWIGSDDGFLVLDRNGDGVINDGRELFGDQTILESGERAANGFQALAELDSNEDGVIDVADAGFSQLKVWTDLDGDDYLSLGKFSSLDELGITSINLDSTPDSTTDAQGNTRNRIGSFEWADGSVGQVAEYGLQRDTFHTNVDEWIDLPDEVAVLPYLQGYGNVYDLDCSIMRDSSGELKSLVEQFVSATDPESRNTLLEQILFKWTGSDGIDPASRGSNIDARKLVVLENFFGESFVGVDGSNPTYESSIILNESYRLIFERMYAELMSQTHLRDLYDKTNYAWHVGKVDLSGVIAHLSESLISDPGLGKQTLSEFARSIRGFGAEEMVDYLSFREAFIQQDPSLAWVIDTGGLPVYDGVHQGVRTWSPHIEGTDNADAVKGSLTEGDGWINGLNGNDVVYGTSRHERLVNGSGDAILVAGGGHDRIWAGTGDDILDGGEGNDYLYGAEGNDTYLFRTGSGHDVVFDTDTTPDNTDTIWIGSFLTPDDIAVKRAGNDLVLKIIDTDDTMTVKSFFDTGSVRFESIERIAFADGTVWDVNEINERQNQPTRGDDYLVGNEQDDVIDALEGDDLVLGQGGNDILNGGDGADRLLGGDGDDALDGGEGNDELDGGEGNDTYTFGRGSGQDIIRDLGATEGAIDTVVFTDVASTDAHVTRTGNDLKISIAGSDDSLTVADCFTETDIQCPIEAFTFSDGITWDETAIRSIVLAGTEGSDTIVGYSDSDSLAGLGGDDHIEGRGGEDILVGGSGSDALYGGSGDDLLDGAAGNDTLYGGDQNEAWRTPNTTNGNDTYLFGRGSGQDTIVDYDSVSSGYTNTQFLTNEYDYLRCGYGSNTEPCAFGGGT